MIIHILKHWQSYTAAVLSLLAMYLLSQFPTMVGAPLVVLVWFVLLGLIFFVTYKEASERGVYAFGGLLLFFGSLGLLLLVENTYLQLFLGVLHTALIALYMYMPSRLSAQLAHEFKPWRRMLYMTLTYGLFGVSSTFFGIAIFFQARYVVVYVLLLALISSLVAYISLRLYYKSNIRKLREWSAMIGVLSFELLIALSFTSFGYLAIGALFIWFWYLLLLFVRFQISTRGIDWKKQRLFLVWNGIGFMVLLQLIQWY